ncbi:MAG: PAS domain-containing hybrid sensor histidine kinase/response regulator [Calditrichaeota bacterium]|nr:MAG: response regulator [Calditrichota bacterium]MBL1205347.1 PAS domain-containing hybrid sensor histidine kinase/response regulator [Calditrichota bacterium]NOG45176.1 response regulator [Calditrichota bacterium]
METRLSDLIEDLNDGFCSIRIDGDLIYANQSAKKLLKISDDSSINIFTDVIRNKALTQSIKREIEKSKGLKDIECDLYDYENKKFPVILTVNSIKDIDDSIVGMALLFKDMSALKEMHNQLLQAQKMESIGMLASGIAHEFNNLLSGILPNAELIKMTIEDGSANFSRADAIHKSAQRAGNIVKQLLSFARHDHIDDDVSLNLNRAVSETLEIMSKLFGKEIIVKNKLPINLPLIKIDPTRIQQIIMNLAINARDALEGSGTITFSAKPVTIDIRNGNGLSAGQYVMLSVEDNGKGISRENIEKIFDPFFTTKEPGKGTGLGLSTIYGIIKNLQGDIKVFSDENKGTRFDLYFPESHSKETKNEKVDDISTNKKNKTILIVDDERVIREMAKDMLSYIGYKTICESSALNAITRFKKEKNKIDLVIIDLIMPKMNGVNCYHEIRKISKNVPVIITSGVGEANKRSDMLQMGAAEYLQKPYDVKTFSEIFDKIFSEN